MSTRKIKDGKVDGEKVYFKGHAQATYMSDGRTVEEAVKNACAYPVVNHGTNDTTFTLTPNTFHIWGEVTSLNLSLGAEVSGVVNEYVFQYSVGDSAPTLTFPETIAWVNPPTDNKVNTTYIVSIVNNIGLIVRT